MKGKIMEKGIIKRVAKYCLVGLTILGVALIIFFSMKEIANVSVRKVNNELYSEILKDFNVLASEVYDGSENIDEYIQRQINNSLYDLRFNTDYTIFVYASNGDGLEENLETKHISDNESIMSVPGVTRELCLNSWLTKEEEEEILKNYNNKVDKLTYKEIYGVRKENKNGDSSSIKVTKIVLWDENNVEYTVDHGRADNEECLFSTDENMYIMCEHPLEINYLAFQNNRENYNVFNNIVIPEGGGNFNDYEDGSVYIKESSGTFSYNIDGKAEKSHAYYHTFLVATKDYYTEEQIFPAFSKMRISCIILFVLLIIVTECFMIRSDIKKDRFERAKNSFTRGVAHDMKTPLAIISNLCECYLEGIAPEKNDSYVSDIYKEAGKMNEEIVAFLEYNKLSQMDKIKKEKISFSQLVNEQVERYKPLMQARQLLTNINGEIYIYANREYLALAVSNYISNAIKFSPSDGRIDINLTANEFSVTNTCDSTEFINDKSIWDIMTTRDKARNRSNGSTGMGLPITAEICRVNGIKCGAADRNGKAYFFMTF